MDKLNLTHFDQFVEIYNSQGKDAAIEYVAQKCNMDYVLFQRNMRKQSTYVYDRSTKKFKVQDNENQFMSLEELCNTKPVSTKKDSISNNNWGKIYFDKIVVDLMKDRLSEISKYIFFEQSSKEIQIDSKSLQRDGYTLSIY